MDAPAVTWAQTRAFRLERMHLVEPLGSRSLRKVARDLGGIHAQVHSSAVLQAGSRTDGMSDSAVENALKSKSLVKTWMMRGTIHYLAAEDLPVWASASATRRLWNKPYWQKAFGITAKDVEQATKIIPEALDGKVLTREAIADEVHRITKNKAMDELLRSGWGSVLKILAGEGHLCFGPSQGRNVAFTRPDQWLDRWTEPPPTDEALAAVFLRYLASHGPASRAEFARWWGFAPPEANGVLKALENDLVQVDREGEKAFILKRDLKALGAAEEDDLVRMLPMFDAYTLAGLPHDQIVPKAKKDLVYRKGAWVSQVVLRGGRVIGVWTHERKPKGPTVEAVLFEKRSASAAEMKAALEPLAPFIGEISKLTTV